MKYLKSVLVHKSFLVFLGIVVGFYLVIFLILPRQSVTRVPVSLKQPVSTVTTLAQCPLVDEYLSGPVFHCRLTPIEESIRQAQQAQQARRRAIAMIPPPNIVFGQSN